MQLFPNWLVIVTLFMLPITQVMLHRLSRIYIWIILVSHNLEFMFVLY